MNQANKSEEINLGKALHSNLMWSNVADLLYVHEVEICQLAQTPKFGSGIECVEC